MRTKAHRLSAVGVTLVVAAAGAPSFHAAAAPSTPISFAPPSVMDPVHTFGEPDLGVDAQGRVFASGPTGTGTQRSIWEASYDGGRSFRPINMAVPSNSVQGTNAPPGGGDTDIAFSSDGGHQYYTDLYALACLRVAVTADGGKSTQQNPNGCGGQAQADRQWLAVYDPPAGTPNRTGHTIAHPLVYQEFNNAGAFWVKSTDGLTYTPASATNHFGADGYPAIDQVTGKVFEAHGDGNGGIQMNIGTPNDDAGDLTFLDDAGQPGLVQVVPKGSLVGSPDDHWTVLSMDAARNLFAVYTILDSNPANDQTYVTASSAATGWQTWTTPAKVSNTAVNVFPWIKAGGPGRADAAWYGTDTSTDPNNISGQKWNLYMAQTVFPVDPVSGAITGAPAAVTTVTVSPHPMHFNDICSAGTGCIIQQGNRNLADFFTITMDGSGAAEIVYDDSGNSLCQNPTAFTPGGVQAVDHCGAGVVTVIRQSGGPGLFGANVTGDSNAPRAGISHPAGGAIFSPNGGALSGSEIPALDILDNHLALANGQLTVSFHVADLSSSGLANANVAGAGPIQQYVTRWQMGSTIYYAQMEPGPGGQALFSAGNAESVDLCSVSACFPHVITYPEFGQDNPSNPAVRDAHQESGTIVCPATPSAATPCTVTITVPAADVGNPTSSSLLEEVGSYSFITSHLDGSTTNAQAQADNVPLEINGLCCFNFQGAPAPAVAESPLSIALLLGGLGVGAAAAVRRRRQSAA